ncbi:FAD-binding domain-containing protein 22 [Elsinoe fawcettii]|nr:FAD-binding domain-containing protein 22 [Elsinoe fawcettii]
MSNRIRVVIVGAGLGGLACAIACRRRGMDVAVYDSVSAFTRIGDSIGFGSNSARLLYRWGVGPALAEISCKAQQVGMYNFESSDKMIAVDDEIAQAETRYGCRSLIGHRGDYHLIMADFARSLGVEIILGTRIVAYDAVKPSVRLHTGAEIVGDAIICAEGFKSLGRKTVLGYEDGPIHSGYAIYRGYMDGNLLKDDPIAGKFVASGDQMSLFLGPDMHGFVNTLRDGKEVNAVLTHKDVADVPESWSEPGDIQDVLRLLEGWDPAVRRVWEKMPGCIDWKLAYRPCLPKWVSDSGLVALMGDAAHPFLPTSTQGASQAIEDGATIAACLAKAGKGRVPLALHSFFRIRHDYVADAQASGIRQRQYWHNLHDKETKRFEVEIDEQAVKMSNYYLWANDAEKVVDDRWEEISKLVADDFH